MQPALLASFVLGLAVGLVCAPRSALRPDANHGWPTVLIDNQSIEAVAIYISRFATRVASLHPGERSCVVLRGIIPGTLEQLGARAIGGGLVALSPQQDLSTADGWHWTIGTAGQMPWLAGQQLVPAPRCRVGR